jgi:hypothetical protein
MKGASMKQPSELSREELESVVRRVRDILWHDPATGELDPDRSWDVETIECVSGAIEDAGLKPDLAPKEPLPVRNDRWVRILAVAGGHRYFREKSTGRVAVADDSGGWPEECDGGPLFVDTGSPLAPDRAWIFAVPLVGGGIAMAGVAEAAGLIRRLRMWIEWPSAIREAVAAGMGEPAGLRAALEALIGTIEATGGCIRPDRRTVELVGQQIVEFDGDFPVPAADESWPDLADSYLQACRAVGREPMLRDMDADEIAEDDGDAAET